MATRIGLAIGALLAAFAMAAPPSARAAVPRQFFGVYSEDALGRPASTRDMILSEQASAGVAAVRLPFDWEKIEPNPGDWHFAPYDAFLESASNAGVGVLPVLIGAPDYATTRPGSGAVRGIYPPRDPAQMGSFAATLVARYGPGGSFWQGHPALPYMPIRSWQVWNEPNFPFFWPSGPDASGYAALLEATSVAIKQADPGAEVITAGLANSTLGIPMRPYLSELYQAGAKGSFDTLAIHPYGTDPYDVEYLLFAARSIMDAHGDGSGLRATEFGWATGGQASFLTTDEATQADRVRETLELLAESSGSLRLVGIDYYDWRDTPPTDPARDQWPGHAGLLRIDGSPKPALGAYSETVARLTENPFQGGATVGGGAPGRGLAVKRLPLPAIHARRRIRLSRRWAFAAVLRCSSRAPHRCAGHLQLDAPPAHPATRGVRPLPGILAIRAYDLRAGRSHHFRFVMPRAARSALRRAGRLRVRLIASAGAGGPSVAQTVELISPTSRH